MAQSRKASRSRKSRTVTFSSVIATLADRASLEPVKAGKQLRSKMRAQYGKDDVVTRIVDRKGDNRDGNRYPDVTAAEAKHLLSL
jgi:hypothetical protein